MNSVFYDRELVLRMLEIAEIDLSKSTPLHFRKLERQKFHVVLKEWICLCSFTFVVNSPYYLKRNP